jgi:energy-coupling factor transport system ATP-binding protein
LRGVDLEVPEGEWLALVGANGSGKSTLAKICNALLIPTQGNCFTLGADTGDESLHSEIRRGVALVFQNPEDQIVASIVEEDVAFGPENLGLPPGEIRKRVDGALKLVGLSEAARKGSFSLSGGQKQRLALAGALAMAPRALILDESTSMLDPEGRDSFLSCLSSLKTGGMTIVQITHRMEEAIESDRVVVIDAGRVAWDGSPVEFFDGEYRKWDFEEPPEVALCRELSSRGLLPRGTLPDVRSMLGALCL